MPGIGTPPQTARLLDELAAIRARARQLMTRVPDDASCAWQPAGGRGWSVAQCVDHLTRTNALYLHAIREAVARVPPAPAPVENALRTSWIGRRFVASLEPGSMKMPAPRAIVPALKVPRDEVWRAFEASMDDMERLMRESACVDLNRATFRGPLFKASRMRAGTGLRSMLAHMRRHVAQAERVADARGAGQPLTV